MIELTGKFFIRKTRLPAPMFYCRLFKASWINPAVKYRYETVCDTCTAVRTSTDKKYSTDRYRYRYRYLPYYIKFFLFNLTGKISMWMHYRFRELGFFYFTPSSSKPGPSLFFFSDFFTPSSSMSRTSLLLQWLLYPPAPPCLDLLSSSVTSLP